MGKIKLGLDNKSLEEKIALATTFATKLTGHATLTDPDPTPAELTAQVTVINTKRAMIAALQAQLEAERTALDQQEAKLDQMLTDEAAYIQKASGGDPAIILGTGAELQAERAPTGLPDQVQGVALRPGGNEGELEARFKRDEQARSYELQSTGTPDAPASWQHEGVVMRVRMKLGELESGKKRWVRVRALNSVGSGPWSDPACCMVP